jgi:hypothetical protein
MSLNHFLIRCRGNFVAVKIIGAIEVLYPIKNFEVVEDDNKFSFGDRDQEFYPFEIWKSTIQSFEISGQDSEHSSICIINIQDNDVFTKLKLEIND